MNQNLKKLPKEIVEGIIRRIVELLNNACLPYDQEYVLNIYQKVLSSYKSYQHMAMTIMPNEEEYRNYFKSDLYLLNLFRIIDHVVLDTVISQANEELDRQGKFDRKPQDIKLPNGLFYRDTYKDVLKAFDKGQNLWISGKPGSGKSTVAKVLTNNYSQNPIYYEQGYDLEELVGQPQDSDDKIHQLPLYKAFKTGGIYYIDEFQQRPQNVFKFLSEVFTSRFCLFANKELVFQNPECNLLIIGLDPFTEL